MTAHHQPPFRGKELPHFWALIRKMPEGQTWLRNELKRIGRNALHSLERGQWLSLIYKARFLTDPEYGCSEDEWARIRWLQHQLHWTDDHLENYIKKFGHIDHISWLCTVTARKIMVALQKIIDWQAKKANESEGGKTDGEETSGLRAGEEAQR